MSCGGGLNQIITIPVPAFNGEGPTVDVSGLTARKTFFFSPDFEGEYVILGSHDDVIFVPLLKIEGSRRTAGLGPGPQPIRRDVVFTVKTIKVRRSANKTIDAAVMSQETCAC